MTTTSSPAYIIQDPQTGLLSIAHPKNTNILSDMMPRAYCKSLALVYPAQANHSPGITVTLTPLNNPSDQRRLIVSPGEGITVGRASRSEAKQLEAAPFNALFDCPVVSRQHAELKAHPFKADHEQVSLTDLDSMHGTSVNGRRLAAFEPYPLKSGDTIKFGDKVMRGSGTTSSWQVARSSRGTDILCLDTHDGVRVTFDRSETTNHGYASQAIASSGRSYHVPSESDESEARSEDGSVVDEEAFSSSKTTSEQPKALGSREMPIDVETAEADTTVIGETTMGSRVIPEAFIPEQFIPEPEQRRVVQDTYAESEDADSVVAEDEHDDRDERENHEYYKSDDEAADDIDNLSDSEASDLSNHYDESADISDAEPPELMSSRKEASPELGTQEEFAKPPDSFWRSFPKYSAPVYAMYPQSRMDAGRANYLASNRPYDPVRGSFGKAGVPLSVAEAAPGLASAGISSAPAKASYPSAHDIITKTSAADQSTYTYGSNPDFFGGPLPSKSATDRYDSSRWDIPPPSVSTQSAHMPPQSSFVPWDQPVSQYYTPHYRYPANGNYPPRSSNSLSDWFSAAEPMKMPSEIMAETRAAELQKENTPTPMTKSRISIPDIVDDSALPFVQEEAGKTIKEELNGALEPASVLIGRKRKAADIPDLIAEPPSPDWEEVFNTIRRADAAATATPPAPKKARTMKSVGKEVAKFGAGALVCAAVGAVSTVAFLVSPLAEQLASA